MENNDKDAIGLKGIIVRYLLHWKLFVGVFLFTIIPAVLYIVLYPRTYEMMSRVQIQEDKEVSGGSFGLGEAAGLMKSMGMGSMSLGPINIEDELANMTSYKLIKGMVLDLGLNVEYTKPYSFYRLYRDIPFSLSTDSITNDRLDEDITFKVSLKNGKATVKTKSDRTGKKTFTLASLPGTIALPHGDFILNYAPGQERISDGDMHILYRPAGSVAEELEDEFVIEELSKSSTIIELSYRDYEKQRGVNMLNALIDRYNDTALDYKRSEGYKMISFLDNRIDTVTSELKVIEADIAYYKHQHNLTDIEHDVQFYVEQMRDLQVKLIEMEAQAHVIRMMDEFVKDPANKYTMVPSLLSQESGEGSPVMAYNEVLLERARVIQNSDISNPLVKSLTEQADQLRASVFASISNAQKGIQLSVDDVKRKEKAILDKMSSFPEQEKDFIELKRQQEIFQGVYLVLLQKREETALNTGIDRKKAKIVDSAFVKSRPVAPRKLYAAIGMILFTILIPVGYLFCKEQYVAIKKEFKKQKNNA